MKNWINNIILMTSGLMILISNCALASFSYDSRLTKCKPYYTGFVGANTYDDNARATNPPAGQSGGDLCPGIYTVYAKCHLIAGNSCGGNSCGWTISVSGVQWPSKGNSDVVLTNKHYHEGRINYSGSVANYFPGDSEWAYTLAGYNYNTDIYRAIIVNASIENGWIPACFTYLILNTRK